MPFRRCMCPRRSRTRPARRARRPPRRSSEPSALIVMVEPRAAASSRMPMMLLPSISRAVPRHPDVRLELRRQVHELRRRARVHAELIHDGHVSRHHESGLRAFSPREQSPTPPRWRFAHGRAFRGRPPAGRATARRPASLISIGRLTPVMTSMRSVSRNVMPRFDGVPPNMSVSSSTPSVAAHALDRLRDLLARVVHVVVPADRDGGELRQVADDHLGGVHAARSRAGRA